MNIDLTFGDDIRGDYALFIDEKHFVDEYKLDKEAQKQTQELTFFRVIYNKTEQGSHGWAKNGEIVQWG